MTPTPMSDVRLVAEREIRERLRSKSFRVMTAITMIVVSGLLALSAARSGKHPIFRVGLVNTSTNLVADDLGVAALVGGTRVQPITVANETDARRLVRSKELVLAVIDGGRIVIRNPIEKGDTGHRARFVATLAQRLGVETSLRRAGLPANRAQEVMTAGPVPVQAVRPAGVSQSKREVAIVGIILTFVFLQQYGGWILLGVVEEKTTRVIEVLLSAVRAKRLLSGKIAGIGVVALIQATIVATTALVTSSVVGTRFVVDAAPVTILPALGWLALGYAFFCSLFATAGAMVTSTEDAQNVAFPMMLMMFIGYGVGFAGLTGGDPSPLLRVLAYLPPTAPFCMPVLTLVHGATWWQAGLSAAITLASAAMLLRLAGRVYVASINRTRNRTRLRDLRAILAA